MTGDPRGARSAALFAFTLLDAAAQALDNAVEPMGAKAIWRAIVERGLWSSPNGGKTPYAALPAAIMRDMAAKGAGSRFVKAGRGLFALSYPCSSKNMKDVVYER